jgi:hypothetical protein
MQSLGLRAGTSTGEREAALGDSGECRAERESPCCTAGRRSTAGRLAAAFRRRRGGLREGREGRWRSRSARGHANAAKARGRRPASGFALRAGSTGSAHGAGCRSNRLHVTVSDPAGYARPARAGCPHSGAVRRASHSAHHAAWFAVWGLGVGQSGGGLRREQNLQIDLPPATLPRGGRRLILNTMRAIEIN